MGRAPRPRRAGARAGPQGCWRGPTRLLVRRRALPRARPQAGAPSGRRRVTVLWRLGIAGEGNRAEEQSKQEEQEESGERKTAEEFSYQFSYRHRLRTGIFMPHGASPDRSPTILSAQKLRNGVQTSLHGINLLTSIIQSWGHNTPPS